ncbi:MAG: hypothetical protein AAGD25_31745 [Cyanobacteria bacterium P01_F01_bin.150]
MRIEDCLTGVAADLEGSKKEAVLKKAALFGLKADDDPSDENIDDILDTLVEDVLDCLQNLWGDGHRRAA